MSERCVPAYRSKMRLAVTVVVLTTLFWASAAGEVAAQFRPLPPVEQQSRHQTAITTYSALPSGRAAGSEPPFYYSRVQSSLPATPVAFPHSLTESNLPAAQLDQPPPRLASSKPGLLQRVSLSATVLGRDEPNDVQQNELDLYTTIGLPMPTRESPLLISPGYQLTLLGGPSSTDVPSRLHDAYLEFRWLKKLSPRWGLDIAISPGVHSDFEAWDGDAIRITGHGVGQWSHCETLKVVLGVAYLDRNDVSLLPAAGLIWTPSDSVRMDLLFPKPKLAWRWSCDECREDWFYLAGEFGGGSWSVQRAGGGGDTLTVRDFRLLLGIERKRDGGGGHRVEVGWIFGREFEYTSGIGDFNPEDAFMARAVIAY